MEAKYSLERRHKLINSIQRLKLAFLIKLMIKMSYLAWQQQTYITAMLKVLCLVLVRNVQLHDKHYVQKCTEEAQSGHRVNKYED